MSQIRLQNINKQIELARKEKLLKEQKIPAPAMGGAAESSTPVEGVKAAGQEFD